MCMIVPPDFATGYSVPFFGRGDQPPSTDMVIDHQNQADSNNNAQLSASSRPNSIDEKQSYSSNIPLLATVATPFIGPEDAPHLRYVPSYFSTQLPDRAKQLFPTMVSTFHSVRMKLYTLLWFKPPVGILGAWCSLRIIQKVHGVYSPPPPTSGEEALEAAENKLNGMMMIKSFLPSALVGSVGGSAKISSSKYSPWKSSSLGIITENTYKIRQAQKQTRKRNRKFRRGRRFDLDNGDRSYDNFGGIETVRVRAYQEGLKAVLEDFSSDDEKLTTTSLFGRSSHKQSVDDDENSNSSRKDDVQTAMNALRLLCPPKGSREYFVQENAQALSKLAKYISPGDKEMGKKIATIKQQNIDLLLQHSSKLIEMRTLDALLRTLRDRHLIVASRLRRARDYWKWHLNLSGGWFGLLSQGIRQKFNSVFSWLGIVDFRERIQ